MEAAFDNTLHTDDRHRCVTEFKAAIDLKENDREENVGLSWLIRVLEFNGSLADLVRHPESI